MNVTALHIYPIKSLGGISVNTAEARIKGFQNDRRWMLVDDKGEFLTQRTLAEMANFKCSLTDDSILVNYKSDNIEVPFNLHVTEPTRVKVWSSKLKAYEVSTQISKWFSSALGVSATLVRMTDTSVRGKLLFVPPFKTNLSFADGYPYLILGEASMTTLNQKLEDKVNSSRFRANILLSTQQAHAEDDWKFNFSIGAAKFKVIKACARCSVVNINQETGQVTKEPLKTMADYRKYRKKTWFGANAICVEPGTISIGDEIVLT